MITKENVEKFIAEKNIAIVGVSSSGKKFGAAVYRDLKQKGWHVYGVNPRGGFIGDEPLYETLDKIPVPIEAAVFVVPPAVTEKMVKRAYELGIKNIWMQPGAESQAAIEYGERVGLNIIHGECIMMHAPPVGSVHSVHRFINRLLGMLPT